MLFVQVILFFLYSISTRRSILLAYAPSNSGRTWITFYSKSNRTSIWGRARYDYPSIPHFPHFWMSTTLGHSNMLLERKEMFRNNHRELDKVKLASWVDRTFNQLLSKQSIKVGFKTIGIWPLNPKAMDNWSRPNELYTAKSDLNISNDEDGQLERAVDGTNGVKIKLQQN